MLLLYDPSFPKELESSITYILNEELEFVVGTIIFDYPIHECMLIFNELERRDNRKLSDIIYLLMKSEIGMNKLQDILFFARLCM